MLRITLFVREYFMIAARRLTIHIRDFCAMMIVRNINNILLNLRDLRSTVRYRVSFINCDIYESFALPAHYRAKLSAYYRAKLPALSAMFRRH